MYLYFSDEFSNSNRWRSDPLDIYVASQSFPRHLLQSAVLPS